MATERWYKEKRKGSADPGVTTKIRTAILRIAIGMIRQKLDQSMLRNEGERSKWKMLTYLQQKEDKIRVIVRAGYKIVYIC